MKKNIFIILGLIAAFLILNSIFVVKQTQQAIVLRFGKPVTFEDNGKQVDFINSPGLKFKLPFIENVKYFDSRVLYFNAADKEVLDSANKALTVNAFVRYRIVNPLTFYEKVTDGRGINLKLDKIFEASLRDAIGAAPLEKLLTDERKEVMQTIQADISQKAMDFGINVTDVRIIRADLPKQNSDAIFKRMYTDRNKEAREYRAQGQEDAKKIIAMAEKESTIIRAEAQRDAQIIRGEGDAIATRIFAGAFRQDPKFFEFYRTMQAYKKSINKDNTSLVLSPNSDYLSYFNNIDGNKDKE